MPPKGLPETRSACQRPSFSYGSTRHPFPLSVPVIRSRHPFPSPLPATRSRYVRFRPSGLVFDFDEIKPGHPGCTSHFECIGNYDRVLCHAVDAHQVAQASLGAASLAVAALGAALPAALPGAGGAAVGAVAAPAALGAFL